MKLAPAVVAFLFFAMLAPALVLSANNTTAGNYTPVSISQNATISVPTPATGLANIGFFDNATVFVSGNPNATVRGSSMTVDMGTAPWMGYRDVYLFYRISPGYTKVSFDYDLLAGEKSNVLLIDFADSLPGVGLNRSAVPDHAVLGLGTWTNTYSWIKGMNEIGGLRQFPQGAHHVEVFPDSGMLYMSVDGNVTVYNYESKGKYMVIHLMSGDENSYLRGTLSNLNFEGPPPDDGKLNSSGGNTSGILIPNATLNGKNNGSAGGQLNVSDGKEKTPGETNESKPLVGLNIWLALVAAAGFFIAWAIVYTKYLKR